MGSLAEGTSFLIVSISPGRKEGSWGALLVDNARLSIAARYRLAGLKRDFDCSTCRFWALFEALEPLAVLVFLQADAPQGPG